MDISEHSSMASFGVEFSAIRRQKKIFACDSNRILGEDNFGIQIHRRRFQIDLGVRFKRLLIVRLDSDGVHLDVLVVYSAGGLDVELHIDLSLIVPNWKSQSFDIVPDRNRKIDSAALAAIVIRGQGGHCTPGQPEEGQSFTG
jgi:hypothetical protein